MTGNGVERSAPSDESRSRTRDPRPEDGKARSGFGPPHPLEGISKHVREIIEYANFYVEARKDMLRATVRGLIWKAVAGIVAGIAGVTVIIVAVVYLLSGIAHGLGRLFGDEFWLGELVTAIVIFLGLIVAGWIALRSINRKARERTMKKYERRQQQQRERFGHTTTERAQQLQQAHRS